MAAPLYRAVALVEPLGLAVGGEGDTHAAGEEALEEAAEEDRVHHVRHLQLVQAEQPQLAAAAQLIEHGAQWIRRRRRRHLLRSGLLHLLAC